MKQAAAGSLTGPDVAAVELTSATIRFGGVTAVSNLSLSVPKGSVYSIIGPNGAGKTTVFNAITGLYQLTSGRILLNGAPIVRGLTIRSAVAIAGCGLLTAIVGLVWLNLQPLWEQLIVLNYRFREPFPWSQIPTAAGSYFLHDGLGKVWATLLALFFLGCAIGGCYWQGTRLTPEGVATRGLCRTFQNIRLFPTLSVVENVLVALDRRYRVGLLRILLGFGGSHSNKELALNRQATELLNLVGLGADFNIRASALSYGDQRRLEIARALATNPKLLLLDEPAAGMNPAEAGQLSEMILKIRSRGITVLLIEHHMNVVMSISDRVCVLNNGEKLFEGTPDEVRREPRVVAAYLGEGES